MRANRWWIDILLFLVCLLPTNGWSENWSAPLQLPSHPQIDVGNATAPEIGVDKQGNSFAVWTGQGPIDNVIIASRYDAKTQQWSEPVQIGEGRSAGPRLAVAQDGNAIIVWTKIVDEKERLFFSTYQNGWTSESIIVSAALSHDSHPSVCVDELGNAIVVWQAQLNVQEKRSLASVIRSSSYRFSTSSFGSIVDLSTDYSPQGHSYVGQPEVAVNASGKAVAVWRYNDGGATAAPFRIQANTLQSGLWGTQEDVSTSPTAQLILPVVAVSPKGGAMAIWMQTGFNYYVVTAATKVTTWSPQTTLSGLGYVNTPLSADKGPYLAHAAFDHKGNGFAVWSLIDESSNYPYKVQVCNHLRSGWSKAFTLSESGTVRGSFNVATDALGNGWVVFDSHGDDEDSSSVFASRFIQGMNAWCVPELISTELNSSLPNISTNGAGNFHAVWISEKLTWGTVHSAKWIVFDPLPLPPRKVKGQQTKNDFATQSERINKITWKAPFGGGVPASYRIYNDPTLKNLVAEIPAEGILLYEEPYRRRGKEYTYYLVTVDGKKRMSDPVKVVIQSIP